MLTSFHVENYKCLRDVTVPLTPIHVFPYSFEFRTIRTHVLCPPLTGEGKTDARAIVRAFADGNCFIGYDRFADSSGFRFRFESESGQTTAMGTETSFSERGTLRVALPAEAQITVLRNGEIIEQQSTEALSVPVSRPGVYRVEARRDGIPWIFSNPTYLRETET